MKKHILLSLLSIVCVGWFGVVADVQAGDNFVVGKDQECWYDNYYKNTSGQWAFWFCGAQKASCKGKHKNGSDIGIWLNDGGSFTNRDRTFFCCGGTNTEMGMFKEGKEETVTKVKELGGGATCNYTVVTDPCGKEIVGDCNIPNNCPAGRTLRNGECVAQCPDGQAFESASSNKCVESQTTSTGGTQTVEAGDTDLINAGANVGDKVNRQCDAVTQLWDPDTQKCVSKKKNTIQISVNTMEKCYGCINDADYRNCVRCYPSSSCSEEIKAACSLEYRHDNK